MFVIPVVDLRQGQVVRALRGERQDYRPIVSTLAPGSDPLRLVPALLAHAGSRRLYVADLDALGGGTLQIGPLQALLQARPQIELWLDGGFAGVAQAEAAQRVLGPRLVPVFGSETLRARADLEAVAARADAILSLDRRHGRPLDRAGCWDAPALWPPRVISMTLERVGSDAGPDLETLAALRARAPAAVRLIGAGGVRDGADLDRARAAGAHAWLVASALHDGRIAPQSGPAG